MEIQCPVCEIEIVDSELTVCPQCGYNKINVLFVGMSEAGKAEYIETLKKLREAWNLKQKISQAGTQFQDDVSVITPLLTVIPAGYFAGEFVKAFGLSVYPITFAEFNAYKLAYHKSLAVEAKNREQFPVTNVTWHDANLYCRWLSNQTGYIYRLPTELEWEYAVRAGQESITLVGWSAENARGRSHRVGQLEPNAWGLYDACGNVWEWTCSNYTQLWALNLASQCRSETMLTSLCTIRGGSFRTSAVELVNLPRDGWDINAKSKVVGFRVLREID